MRWISTTIKKKYMEQILSGEKDVEYKGDTPFWAKRLVKFQDRRLRDVGINFLCGRKSYKFYVERVWWHNDSYGILVDEKIYKYFWSIHLGERIK